MKPAHLETLRRALAWFETERSTAGELLAIGMREVIADAEAPYPIEPCDAGCENEKPCDWSCPTESGVNCTRPDGHDGRHVMCRPGPLGEVEHYHEMWS